MKRSLLILLATITFFTGTMLVRSMLLAGPAIEATLIASPSSLTAYCPATIKFTGAIKVLKACTVQYKFVRSDGASGPMVSLSCPVAGTYPVNTTWTIGATYSGWEAIEVISPVAVKSDKAGFSLTCLPKPYIDPDYLNTKLTDTVLQLYGNNFGNTQGNKKVTLDGQPTLPKPGWSLVQWKDNCIRIALRPCDVVMWDHVYQLAITEGNQVVSNVVQFRFLFQMSTPNNQFNYTAGQTLVINVYNLPPSQVGYDLRIYGWTAIPIHNWAGSVGCNPGQIKADLSKLIIPHQYVIGLYKGSQIISDDGFTIQIVPLSPPPTIKK
jgi:hypothetical protein